MPRQFAFLRAINVGGHNVTMDALRTHFEAAGASGVETFIASGNVIFNTRRAGNGALEAKLEKHLLEALGYEVKVFLRNDAELAAIAAYAPFNPGKLAAATTLNIGFVAQPLASESVAALMALRTEIDDFHVHGREVYWACTGRQGESTFSNALFERKIKVRVTFRGAATVTKLAAKYGLAR